MSLFGAVASLPQAALSMINSHTKSRTVTDSLAGTGGVKAAAAAAPPSSAAQATTDIGTTFLSLLTKELQNQDPTAPMDSTAMVGQMISLNQLDQLIAIHTAVTPTPTTPPATGAPTTPPAKGAPGHAVAGPTADSASTLAAKQALLAATLSSNPASNSPLSIDSTLNAAAQSASETGALNLSNFNSMFGGK